jgi:peptidyl-dipeptidase A
VAGARRFLAHAESVLYDLSVRGSRAEWVAETYITFDTEELTAQAQEAYGNATRDFAMQARRYERLRLPQTSNASFCCSSCRSRRHPRPTRAKPLN